MGVRGLNGGFGAVFDKGNLVKMKQNGIVVGFNTHSDTHTHTQGVTIIDLKIFHENGQAVESGIIHL